MRITLTFLSFVALSGCAGTANMHNAAYPAVRTVAMTRCVLPHAAVVGRVIRYQGKYPMKIVEIVPPGEIAAQNVLTGLGNRGESHA